MEHTGESLTIMFNISTVKQHFSSGAREWVHYASQTHIQLVNTLCVGDIMGLFGRRTLNLLFFHTAALSYNFATFLWDFFIAVHRKIYFMKIFHNNNTKI